MKEMLIRTDVAEVTVSVNLSRRVVVHVDSLSLLLVFSVGPVIMSIEEKMEADGRSIYVGNVSNCLLSSAMLTPISQFHKAQMEVEKIIFHIAF